MQWELQHEQLEPSYYPWLGGERDPVRSGQTGGRAARQVSDLVDRVRVVADTHSNSLLITTNAHYFQEGLEVVDDLDMPRAQVLLEATIIEIARDDRERLGVRWSPDGNMVFDPDDFDNSIIGNAGVDYRQFFAGAPGLDGTRSGVFTGEANVDFLIQFLQKYTDSRVRAEPRLNVADNEIGRLFVGDRVPFITRSQTSPEGTRNDAFEYRDVGIILEVIPTSTSRARSPSRSGSRRPRSARARRSSAASSSRRDRTTRT